MTVVDPLVVRHLGPGSPPGHPGGFTGARPEALFGEGVPAVVLYREMSNQVPADIKPMGASQGFSAPHLGHCEAYLYALVGTVWGMARLLSRTFTNLFIEAGKLFLRAHCTRFLSPPVLGWGLFFVSQDFLPPGRFAPRSPPPPDTEALCNPPPPQC